MIYYDTLFITSQLHPIPNNNDKEDNLIRNPDFYFLDNLFYPIDNPLDDAEFFCSVCKVYGTRNDRLELSVSMQKSVLKNVQLDP